ncbi:MAG: ubiquitin carboxyl-terminal hydrolase [Benjaminiella poitrasii]|nr:MAG: ubiquitin carboxyl-terminal hydrolase [Benjaminiella poitrasii]
MTKSMAPDNQRQQSHWQTLQPDPGTLTKLCSNLETQGIQIEELKSFDKETMNSLKPVYGVFMLIKHNNKRSLEEEQLTKKEENKSSQNNRQIYFSQQITHEAYAIHALSHILLNSDEIEIGNELNRFKQISQNLTSLLRGITLMNNQHFRKANNSCFISKKGPQKQVCYYSISYVRYNGYLWELDAFKKNPSRLVACNESNWLDNLYTILSQRREMEKSSVSLWTVIEDRNRVYQRKLVEKDYIKKQIENRLDMYRPDWRSHDEVFRWQEEYRHSINNNMQMGTCAVNRNDELLSFI